MPAKNRKESFALILSHLRQGIEKASEAWENISEAIQNPRMKEELEVRVVLSRKVLDTLDHCLKLVVLIEDLCRELAELQNATDRQLFILAKTTDLICLRIAEYKTLFASADMCGYDDVAVLLESCLVDMLAFVKQNIVETELAAKRVGEQLLMEPTNP